MTVWPGRGRCRLRYRSPEAEHEGSSEEEQTLQQSDRHNLLPPGTASYKPLNDVYVIIITPFDLFGKGLYKYTFNMGCQEAPGIRLEDGATRIFLNTRGKNPEGVNDELIDLLKYFQHSTGDTARNSSSRRIARLHEKISDIKASEEIGVKFMNAWEEKLLDQAGMDMRKGKRKGLAEGEEKRPGNRPQERSIPKIQRNSCENESKGHEP